MTEFNRDKAIAHYTDLMKLIHVGAYDEREVDGSYGADGVEESIDDLERLAARHGLEFVWHQEVSTYTLEPMSAETREAREAASQWSEEEKLAKDVAAFRHAMQEPEEAPASEFAHTHMTLSAQAQALIHPTTGRLVIVQAGKTVDLDANEAWNLLDLLYNHRDLLYEVTHQEEQAESE